MKFEASEVEVSEWQPIQTVPKDGEDVLLWIPEDESMEVAFWRDDANAWDTFDGWLQGTPSHWMRPDPPVNEVTEK